MTSIVGTNCETLRIKHETLRRFGTQEVHLNRLRATLVVCRSDSTRSQAVSIVNSTHYDPIPSDGRFYMFLCIALAGRPWSSSPKDLAHDVRWKNGPSTDPHYFPIAVWLQDPRNASRYKQAGINLYVGLWEGPTEAQLSTLKDAGINVICSQNRVGLAHKGDRTIIGWMHGDKQGPNAQPVTDPQTRPPRLRGEPYPFTYRRRLRTPSRRRPYSSVLARLGPRGRQRRMEGTRERRI